MNKLEAKLVKQLLAKSKFGIEDIVVVAALMDMVELSLGDNKGCSVDTETEEASS